MKYVLLVVKVMSSAEILRSKLKEATNGKETVTVLSLSLQTSSLGARACLRELLAGYILCHQLPWVSNELNKLIDRSINLVSTTGEYQLLMHDFRFCAHS